MKPEIRSKRQEQSSKSILLLHANVRPHTAAHAVETVQKPKCEALAHRIVPDLAPSDYRLLGPLKGALRGFRFIWDKELKEAVRVWGAA